MAFLLLLIQKLFPYQVLGDIIQKKSTLHEIEKIEIKSMTAKEEDILMNESFVNNGTVFDRLIDSIIVTPGIRAADMQDCDKMAVLLHARKTGYGDNINISTICDTCAHEFEADVSISGILENTSAEIEESEEWEKEDSTGLITANLPVSNMSAKIKILNPEERAELVQTIEKKKKLNIEYSETVEFLRKIIVSVNNIEDRESINKICEVLPTGDARKITKIHNKCIPSIDMSAEITCPACSASFAREVPFSLGWFWSE